MTELLTMIDNSLQEVEEQLLDEFDRVRNSLSDSPYAPIDTGIKNALGGIVAELYAQLDQSGDSQNLQLMTDLHEVLLARIVVLRRLIDSKVPTAYLHEAHTEVSANRRQLEAKVVSLRSREEDIAATPEKSGGLFGKLKVFFGGDNQTEKEVSRNRIQVTEQEVQALEPVNIYLDNGIYSASRELAALANVFNLPEPQKAAIEAEHKKRIAGKAQFSSRDLATQAATANPDRDIAQSPEAIRRKLAERQSGQDGKASFAARDIEHAQVNQAQAPGSSAAELAKKRRTAEETAKSQRPTTGKASFTSRDIEPVAALNMLNEKLRENTRNTSTEKLSRPQDAKPFAQNERPKSGKAVFESKDLSPRDKR
jgi:hypothetical protein